MYNEEQTGNLPNKLILLINWARRFEIRKSFNEVLKYTDYAIKTIGQKSTTDEEKEFFINETRNNFINHINSGFQEYRKSDGSDDMAWNGCQTETPSRISTVGWV